MKRMILALALIESPTSAAQHLLHLSATGGGGGT
jgi:hypothetical protein